jgi:hypothetical protein
MVFIHKEEGWVEVIMVRRFGERKEERKIFGDDEVEALCLPRLGVPKAP